MSDPRNAAHAKKVIQEKKHHGKKPAVANKSEPAGTAAALSDTASSDSAAQAESPKPPPVALEGSLVVLAKLKDLEFHSRANLERLAELTLTVEDELKQKEMVSPLAEVYAAQSALQAKLTVLIEAYKAECDRMHGESA